jgi:hypothetical protein
MRYRAIPVNAEVAGSDWRGDLLERIRTLIHEADPDVTEEAKW